METFCIDTVFIHTFKKDALVHMCKVLLRVFNTAFNADTFDTDAEVIETFVKFAVFPMTLHTLIRETQALYTEAFVNTAHVLLMFDRDAFVHDKFTIDAFVVVWFRQDVFVRDVFVAHTLTIEAFVHRRRVFVTFVRLAFDAERFTIEAVLIETLVKEAFVDC
jgi:hypothetical protein